MEQTGPSILEGRLYIAAQRITRVVLLSALWGLISVPLVTIGPATAALFAVVRRWHLGEDPALVPNFLRYFRENLRQGLASGFILLVTAALLPVNLVLTDALAPRDGSAFGLVAVVVSMVVLAGVIYHFPLMVTYDMPWWRLVRVAFMLAIGRPSTTVLCLILIVGTAALTYAVPVAPLFVSGLVASGVYRLSMRAVEQVGSRPTPATPTGVRLHAEVVPS
ncbi:YesL family protein [Ruania halotolerans]|uniref:YesL family protein n=1 Tax=Ruania halotolerans TaxID=2897773 RepID=UPI001E317B6E|nr:DUF624 domain-containing protein [Ruania halotolerans]UFU06139.1 DUF624 domain-containing protein [Ruania halotolerans]